MRERIRSDGVSVPYAHLSGEWEVLRETDDGRTTIATRSDDRAGVAISYPYAEREAECEDVNKVAAVCNLDQEYVLLAGSFVSLDAIDRHVIVERGQREVVDADWFHALADPGVMDLLSGRTLVVIDSGDDGWWPGALQLFRDNAGAGQGWLRSFPLLTERFLAVQRSLAGVGLSTIADEWTRSLAGDDRATVGETEQEGGD